MANFKVVFRSDNQGADTSPGWEPGCPLLVNAVQVSRNTDTGQCYLQLKLSNISGATVDSFKLQADVSYVDGDYNEFVVKFLGQLAQNNYEDSRDLRNSYIERWKSEYPDIAE